MVGEVGHHCGGARKDLGLKVDSAFAGSTEGLVLAVRRNGARAVLKLGLPSADISRQARVCRLPHVGMLPQVLAFDEVRNAVLLEAFGCPMPALGWSREAEMRAACRTLQCLWRTRTTGADLPTGRDEALAMRDFVKGWHGLLAPGIARARDRAAEYAEERAHAHRDATSVLVHGDMGRRNIVTLRATDTAPGAECRLIDPLGLLAEPAYDLAFFMRAPYFTGPWIYGPARLGRAQCALLAELSGAEERAIWQWGFLTRVFNGLSARRRGIHRKARRLLGMAEALAEAAPPR